MEPPLPSRSVPGLTLRLVGSALLLSAAADRPAGGPSLEPPVVVEVRNASGRPGLARQVTRLLRENGVDVVYFGNAAPEVDTTMVLVRRASAGHAQTVARLIGTRRVATALDSTLRVDLTVLLGRDYRLPKGRLPL